MGTALDFVDRIPEASWFKVGHQLFTTEGPDAVRALKDRGKHVFLDLKYHDIPNTVAHGVESARRLGVDLTTVHVQGGATMLRAAAEAGGDELLVVGVTVLTSTSVAELASIWGRDVPSVRDEAVRLARAAAEAGLGGVVCSPHEVAAIKSATDGALRAVTPGVRFRGGDAHDQARVSTPGDAARAGSDYLVIGRAISGAEDPAAAFRRATDEITAATVS